MGLPPARLALLISISAALGCGNGSHGEADGDVGTADAGTPDAEPAITPPNIPWLGDGVPPDVLTPCPVGWREVTVDGLTECDPYPESGPATCDVGDAHFPGEPECRPIGDPCPVGDFATALPTEGLVLYVNADAAPGGDGSLATPYQGLSGVNWASLSVGTTVALAKGTYEGTLPLKPGVTVLGACAAETILTGVDAPVPAVVLVTARGESAVVRNLSIRNPHQYALRIDQGRAVTLEGVLIEGASTVGIAAMHEDTTVTLRDVVVRNTAPDASDGRFGQGLVLQSGARLDAQRLLVEENHESGISVALSHATLTDTVIRNTQPNAGNGRNGMGLSVSAEGQVDAQRLLVDGNHVAGILINGTGSTARLTDAVIRNTQPQGGRGSFGRGVLVQEGEFDARRLLVRDNRDVGIFCDGAGTAVNLRGAVVRDTQAGTTGEGKGVSVQFGAHLDAEALVIQGNSGVGLFAGGDGSQVSLIDVVLRDTMPRPADGVGGQAISLTAGALLDAARLLLDRNHYAGLLVNGEATAATLLDTVVRDTRPPVAEGANGRGIQVQFGASLEGDHLGIDSAYEVGVTAFSGAEVGLRDVAITGIRRAACAGSSCADKQLGYGASAINAALRLTRFRIFEAATCGVLVDDDGEPAASTSLDLEGGTVSESVIGACVQVEGYDVARLSNDVAYHDNGTNLDATMLPTPGSIATLE